MIKWGKKFEKFLPLVLSQIHGSYVLAIESCQHILSTDIVLKITRKGSHQKQLIYPREGKGRYVCWYKMHLTYFLLGEGYPLHPFSRFYNDLWSLSFSDFHKRVEQWVRIWRFCYYSLSSPHEMFTSVKMYYEKVSFTQTDPTEGGRYTGNK